MTYLLKRGKGARRRVAHLAEFNPITGRPSMIPLCGDLRLRFDTTSNVPWGQPLCKRCRKAAG